MNKLLILFALIVLLVTIAVAQTESIPERFAGSSEAMETETLNNEEQIAQVSVSAAVEASVDTLADNVQDFDDVDAHSADLDSNSSTHEEEESF